MLIIHEMSRVTRISVTRHTSTLPRLMRSYDGLRAECGTCQYYSQIMDHVLYPHYQHHLLPAHNLQWSLDLYEGWAIL